MRGFITTGALTLVVACGGGSVSTGESDSDGSTGTDGGTGSVSATSTSGSTDSGGSTSSGGSTGGATSGGTTGTPAECGDGIPDVGVVCHVQIDLDASYSEAATFADINGDGHLDVVWAGAFPCPAGEGGTHAHSVPGLTQAPDVVHEGAFIGFAGWAVGDGGDMPTTSDDQLFDLDAPVRGLGAGDFAGDGSDDILVVGDDALRLAVNDGAGALMLAAPTVLPAYPRAWGFGDFSGDGRPDVVVAPGLGVGPAASVDVWISDGSGGFTAQVNVATGPEIVDLAVTDVDGDDDLDVVTLRADGLQIHLGDGSGALTDGPLVAPVPASPLSLALTDVNDDGALDAVAGYDDSSEVWLFVADGTGSFGGPTGYDAGASAWALAGLQLDAEAPLDVFAFAQGGDVSGLFGTGTGLSAPDGTSMTGFDRPTVGDLNEDGVDDVVMRGGGGVRLLVSDP